MPTDFDWRKWGSSTLRAQRQAQGLTREELARRAGVSDATIRNLETGRHRPHNRIVLRLCSALHLSVPWTTVLLIPLDGSPRSEAAAVLLRSLRDFLADRRDRSGFIKRHHPDARWHDIGLLIFQLEQQCDLARRLSQHLTEEADDRTLATFPESGLAARHQPEP